MSVLGRNIVGEFFGCPSEVLNDVLTIESKMVGAAQAAHATVISSTFHHFSPFGVSGVVVIQESHLAIHTWPEYGYAALDVFTCGETIDPWDVYKFLHAELKVQNGSAIELGRGQRQLLDWQPIEQPGAGANRRGGATPPAPLRNIWFTEIAGDVGMSLRHAGEPLLRTRSAHQKIEIFDTLAYGRALVLDGMVMTTEQDEYVYHEMATHPALLTHPAPKRVLVIGGGDGGVARELVRHEMLEEVIVVEIDQAVIDASRRHLPTLSRGLLHPKVKLVVGDGVAYVRAGEAASFDVIVIDSTLPLGTERGRFARDFFAQARRLLRPDGILISQAESPRHDAAVFAEICAAHRDCFGDDRVFPYLISVPTYPSGQWGLLYSGNGARHPLRDFDDERAKRFAEAQRLRYFSDDVHRAAFALPGCVKELLRCGKNCAQTT